MHYCEQQKIKLNENTQSVVQQTLGVNRTENKAIKQYFQENSSLLLYIIFEH